MKTSKLLYAWAFLRSIRHNDEDGFSYSRSLRLVCRYHTYLVRNDWDFRYQFQTPATREAFILACEQAMKEIMWCYQNGIYDSFNHYLKCHRFLLTARLIARRLPLLWHLAYLWPLL